MLNAGKDLRIAYLNRLNGAITGIHKEDGSIMPAPVKVYDSAAVKPDAIYPRVMLSTFISTEIGQGSKDVYGQNCSLLVDIASFYSNSFGGKQQCDEIADIVIPLIRTRTGAQINMGSNWNVITSTLEEDSTLEEKTASGLLVRRLIRFNHIIHQLTNNN